MKTKAFFLLLFFTSCIISAQIPEGKGRVTFQIYDGIGKQMNLNSPFKPQVDIKFIKNIPGDDSWSAEGWFRVDSNFRDVVPGIYEMRFTYTNAVIFEKNIEILPNKGTNITAQHLGRISFEIYGSSTELIKKNHKEYPTIQIYDEGFHSNSTKIETSYADVIAGRGYNIKLRYHHGGGIRKTIEVSKLHNTPLIARDLGKIEFKSLNHLNQDIISSIFIDSGSERINIKSNQNIIFAKQENNTLNITFRYPDAYGNIEIEKKDIAIEPGKTVLVESIIASVDVSVINAFGNTENTRLETKNQNSQFFSRALKVNTINYLETGTYEFECMFSNNEKFIKTINLTSGKENKLTFKSKYGSLELQPVMANNNYASIPVKVKNDDIVKTVIGNQKLKLLPGVYRVEFNYSESNIVEKKVTVIADSTVISRTEFDFGEISISIQNPFSEEIKLAGEIIDSEGKSHGQFNTDNNIGLPPGDYTLKFKVPNNQLFVKRSITVITGKKTPIVIKLEDYGRLKWDKESYFGITNINYKLLNDDNKVISAGFGTQDILPAENYTGVFTTTEGLNITLDNILVVSKQTKKIDLSLSKGKFKFVVKSFDNKILDISHFKVKNNDGGEKSVILSEDLELPIGTHHVKYEDFSFISNWRTVNINKGNNIDEVRMGRVYFNILDVKGKKEKKWNFEVYSNGGMINNDFAQKDYIDFCPGDYKLLFKINDYDYTIEKTISVKTGKSQTLTINADYGRILIKAKNITGKILEEDMILKNSSGNNNINVRSGDSVKVNPGKYSLHFKKGKREDINVKAGEDIIVEWEEGKTAVKFVTLDAIGNFINVDVGILKGVEFIKKIESKDIEQLDLDTYTFSFIYPGPYEFVKKNIELKADIENIIEIMPNLGRLSWELEEELIPDVQLFKNDDWQDIKKGVRYVDLPVGPHKLKFHHSKGLDTIIEPIKIVEGKINLLELKLQHGKIKFVAKNNGGNKIKIIINKDWKLYDTYSSGETIKLPIGTYTAFLNFSKDDIIEKRFQVKSGQSDSLLVKASPRGKLMLEFKNYKGEMITHTSNSIEKYGDRRNWSKKCKSFYMYNDKKNCVHWNFDNSSFVRPGKSKFTFTQFSVLDTILDIRSGEITRFAGVLGGVDLNSKNEMENIDIEKFVAVNQETKKEYWLVERNYYPLVTGTYDFKITYTEKDDPVQANMRNVIKNGVIIESGKLTIVDLGLNKMGKIKFNAIDGVGEKTWALMELINEKGNTINVLPNISLSIKQGLYDIKLDFRSEKIADMELKGVDLNEIEESKLKDLGKSREHYEQLAENLTKDVSQQGS